MAVLTKKMTSAWKTGTFKYPVQALCSGWLLPVCCAQEVFRADYVQWHNVTISTVGDPQNVCSFTEQTSLFYGPLQLFTMHNQQVKIFPKDLMFADQFTKKKRYHIPTQYATHYSQLMCLIKYLIYFKYIKSNKDKSMVLGFYFDSKLSQN